MRVDDETVTVALRSYDAQGRNPEEVAKEKQAFFEALQQSRREGTPPPEPPPSLRPTPRELISLGNRKAIWSPLVATCDDPEFPVVATVEIVTPESDGSPRAVHIEVDARDDHGAVDSEALRIPVAAIIRHAVERWVSDAPPGFDAPPGTRYAVGERQHEMFTYGPTVEPVELPRRSHVARSDERLRRVVQIHNAAPWGKRGEAVAKEEGVSVNTARNLVSEARRRGLFEEKEQQ
jgi:hypothetical protein